MSLLFRPSFNHPHSPPFTFPWLRSDFFPDTPETCFAVKVCDNSIRDKATDEWYIPLYLIIAHDGFFGPSQWVARLWGSGLWLKKKMTPWLSCFLLFWSLEILDNRCFLLWTLHLEERLSYWKWAPVWLAVGVCWPHGLKRLGCSELKTGSQRSQSWIALCSC